MEIDTSNVKVGDKFSTLKKLKVTLGINSSTRNQTQLDKELELVKCYLDFEKTGKIVKGKETNEIVITEIYDIPFILEDKRKHNSGRPSMYYEDFMKILRRILYFNDGFIEYKTGKFFTELGLKCWIDEESMEPDWDTELDYDYLNNKMYEKRKYITDSSLAKAYKEGLIYYGHDLYIGERQANDWEKGLYELCIDTELKNVIVDDIPTELTIKQLHGKHRECIADFYVAVKKRFIKYLKDPDVEPSDIGKRYWVKWINTEELLSINVYDINVEYAEGVRDLNYTMQNALFEAVYKYKVKHNKSDEWYESNLNKLEAYTTIEPRIQKLIDIYD